MILREILSLYGLEDTDIESVEQIFSEEIHYRSGDFFVAQGQVVKGMALITKGAFRHFYYDREGEEHTHWISLKGTFLTSFASFACQTPTKGNIQAIKTSDVLFASKKDWDTLLQTNDRIRTLWYKSVEELMIRLEDRIHNYIVLNAEERYRWMCEYHQFWKKCLSNTLRLCWVSVLDT
jgi:CRP-like cAMP-binding protein